jgi:S1-C subfamily serine protease
MEDLNKTQIVLLTLFITFVTSVTTGIVTVTLLEQAPPGVTQTINRVVERTIEKVTPVVTKTETRVVGQEDEIIRTASLNKSAIVRIVHLSDSITSSASSSLAAVVLADTDPVSKEIGTGFLVSADGLVATAYSLIPDLSINYGVYVGEKKYTASVVHYNKGDGLVLLKIDNDKSAKFFVPQFITKPVRLGQTVVVLGRDLSRYTVSVGLVSSLKDATSSTLPSFKTTVRSDDTNIGGPLLASDGSVAGLNLEAGNALPIELIRSRLTLNATSTKTAN